jgi:hypothetical protein
LSDEQIANLLTFLEALTSPTAADLSNIVPEAVPSGLPVGGQSFCGHGSHRLRGSTPFSRKVGFCIITHKKYLRQFAPCA